MSAPEREQIEVDVAVVGGGPAGLAAAIHLVQEARRRGLPEPQVALLEKAPEFGAHSLSGAILDPRSLDLLLPDWRQVPALIEGEVTEEEMLFLTPSSAWRVPFVPASMSHHGGVIVSLQKLTAWLGERAEKLEINLFPGFAAGALLWEEDRVVGVRTGDRGLDRKGQPKGNFEAGYDVRARLTLLADGVRGTLSQELIRDQRLDEEKNPMIFAGGVKEVWKLPAGKVKTGRVWHTFGWPLPTDTFGGAFVYEMRDNLVALGLVAGLDSPDPRLDIHEHLQRLKTHPRFRSLLEGGEIVAYGAKAIPEGGYWAVPKLAVNGALLLGDAAGLVNAARLKGIHLALESGRLAAVTALEALKDDDLSAPRLMAYDRRVKDGLIGQELFQVRNFRQAYQGGLAAGFFHTAVQMATSGRGLRQRYPAMEDHKCRATLAAYRKPPAPTPAYDGKYLLDKMADLYHSGTRHEENQPPHLIVTDPDLCRTRCRQEFGNPCVAFCPAGVYEMKSEENGGVSLHLNFSNCVHCKICDIADPYGIIFWIAPEGGEGPRYKNT